MRLYGIAYAKPSKLTMRTCHRLVSHSRTNSACIGRYGLGTFGLFADYEGMLWSFLRCDIVARDTDLIC